jgi:hypothetical protein
MAEQAAPGDETDLRIGVLGPLLGTRGGIEFTAPHGRAGVLLAVLAVSVGQPVSCRRLAEVIWSDEPIATVPSQLHGVGAVRATAAARLSGWLRRAGGTAEVSLKLAA